MKLRRMAALAGSMVLTLGVAGAVYADSGNPANIQAAVSGNTVTVTGDWSWAKCGTTKIIGWAVSWGDPDFTGNPLPKVGGGFYYMGDANQGNAVKTTGDACTGTSGPLNGSLSHTYAAPGTYDVCVIVYDIVKNKDGSYPTGKHGVLAGGDDRNIDNSVEENDLEGQHICLSPEIPVVIPDAPSITIDKTASPTQLLAAGGTSTYSYLVTNTGNIKLWNIKVTDDAGTPGNTADDAAFSAAIVCPESSLDAGASMTCHSAAVTFPANAGTTSVVTTNIASVSADTSDDCNECSITSEPDHATVTVLAAGVEAATDKPTAPPTDGIATSTTDAGGSLPLLLIVLGIIGLGAVVLTPGRAKR